MGSEASGLKIITKHDNANMHTMQQPTSRAQALYKHINTPTQHHTHKGREREREGEGGREREGEGGREREGEGEGEREGEGVISFHQLSFV